MLIFIVAVPIFSCSCIKCINCRCFLTPERARRLSFYLTVIKARRWRRAGIPRPASFFFPSPRPCRGARGRVCPGRRPGRAPRELGRLPPHRASRCAPRLTRPPRRAGALPGPGPPPFRDPPLPSLKMAAAPPPGALSKNGGRPTPRRVGSAVREAEAEAMPAPVPAAAGQEAAAAGPRQRRGGCRVTAERAGAP